MMVVRYRSKAPKEASLSTFVRTIPWGVVVATHRSLASIQLMESEESIVRSRITGAGLPVYPRLDMFAEEEYGASQPVTGCKYSGQLGGLWPPKRLADERGRQTGGASKARICLGVLGQGCPLSPAHATREAASPYLDAELPTWMRRAEDDSEAL